MMSKLFDILSEAVKLTNLGKVQKRYRREYYTFKVQRSAASCGSGLRVNGPSKVNTNTHLGNNVNFNGLSVQGGGKVVIGDNFHSGPECLIICQVHNYDAGDAVPYDSTYLLQEVTIEDNVWLGSRVIILGDVTIGEGAIIQAGSCVTTDIPKLAIAGGHPATVFKYRNEEHYQKLKSERKFH